MCLRVTQSCKTCAQHITNVIHPELHRAVILQLHTYKQRLVSFIMQIVVIQLTNSQLLALKGSRSASYTSVCLL